MTKLYHYTSFTQFQQILSDEALLSQTVKLARMMNSKSISYENALQWLMEKNTAYVERNPSMKDEMERSNSVYLSKTLEQMCHDGVSADAHKIGEMVALVFDCPASIVKDEEPEPVKLIELSLEYLTEVYSQLPVIRQVRGKLKTEHGGKYQKVSVKPWTKV